MVERTTRAVIKRLENEEKWINGQKDPNFLVDYFDLAEKFDISPNSAMCDVVRLVRRENVDISKILHSKDGKNFRGEEIVRVHKKYPKFPGIQCARQGNPKSLDASMIRKLKYAYILTVNDSGKRVLDGPFIPGNGRSLEETIDRLDRSYEIVYLPTSNYSTATSMVRSNVSKDEGVDKASTTRISHGIGDKRLSDDRGGL